MYVAVLVAFFALAAAFVAACDKIVGEFEVAEAQPGGTPPVGTPPGDQGEAAPGASGAQVPA